MGFRFRCPVGFVTFQRFASTAEDQKNIVNEFSNSTKLGFCKVLK